MDDIDQEILKQEILGMLKSVIKNLDRPGGIESFGLELSRVVEAAGLMSKLTSIDDEGNVNNPTPLGYFIGKKLPGVSRGEHNTQLLRLVRRGMEDCGQLDIDLFGLEEPPDQDDVDTYAGFTLCVTILCGLDTGHADSIKSLLLDVAKTIGYAEY